MVDALSAGNILTNMTRLLYRHKVKYPIPAQAQKPHLGPSQMTATTAKAPSPEVSLPICMHVIVECQCNCALSTPQFRRPRSLSTVAEHQGAASPCLSYADMASEVIISWVFAILFVFLACYGVRRWSRSTAAEILDFFLEGSGVRSASV